MLEFLNKFKLELLNWINTTNLNIPTDPIKKMIVSIDIAIDLIEKNRKVVENEKDFFEGGYFLIRYFDGWGEEYYKNYSKMVDYIKNNHY